MKTLKIIFLVFVAAVGIALVYPGIPKGVMIESHISATQKYAMLHCYYLHWTGIRVKNIDLSSEITNSGISMNNKPCFQWSNWNPANS
jgi:hypothetical protein